MHPQQGREVRGGQPLLACPGPARTPGAEGPEEVLTAAESPRGHSSKFPPLSAEKFGMRLTSHYVDTFGEFRRSVGHLSLLKWLLFFRVLQLRAKE